MNKKLDTSIAEKESNYAYVMYLKAFKEQEVDKNGNWVIFNKPTFQGEIDIVNRSNYEYLKDNFPDKIKADAIKYGSLENTVTFAYDNAVNEYFAMGAKDEEIDKRIGIMSTFRRDGKLKAYEQSEDSLNELANKAMGVIDSIRDYQIRVASQEQTESRSR